MRVALAVHQVVDHPSTNLTTMCRMVGEAADAGADLVVFSEAAVSGFVGTGDPSWDRTLAQSIPGEATNVLARTAAHRGIAVAFGLYETDESGHLFDSAVLITAQGWIDLHYRRITPQWHRRGVDATIYREGDTVPVCETPMGRVAILLCGDLFDDEVVQRVASSEVDLLVVPFAREFDSDVHDEDEWHRVELGIYAQRAGLTGATTLLVNQLGPGEGRHFGGALAVDPDGALMGHRGLGTQGMLLLDV